MHVLFVCTGNVFRSPMAQGFLEGAARRRGLAVTAASAGTLPGDRPVSPDALALMGADGEALAGRRSRPLQVADLQAADLVVGLAREHVRHAVVLDPAVWPRTFTLKELVRRATPVGPRPAGQPLADWLAQVADGRHRRDLLGEADVADDVPDPLAARPSVLRRTAQEVEALVERLLELLAPPPVGG